MSIINLRNVTLGYGGKQALIENANLTIHAGERVCIIGRNGAGKSTLLKAIQGEISVDQGSIERSQHLKIAVLTQAIPDLSGNVLDIVMSALRISGQESWECHHQAESVISRLSLDAQADYAALSGGLKRRVLLAQALVNDPDVLLLDEPTNHLDIEAIDWLEKFLLNFKKTLIFITHDRLLMEKIATHIVEIDNGGLISWRGAYQDYLRHKQTSLEAEARANALFDKKLAQEEAWIRQGIKARRTRNEGRVRALQKMREQRRNRRIRPGDVKLMQNEVNQSGKIIFAVENVSYQYDEKPVIANFSTLITREDKVGILGPNGSGKSTLLNLLLGNLQPQAGTIQWGTHLQVAYFDQYRAQLDEEKTVVDNVREGSDMISVGGQSKHVMSYLQDFLFTPDRARCPVKILSGGERNRLLLAKLFAKPCNVLVLDEPTNDLDVETLELLEEQLLDFPGTLLLVSHDRAFLNNIATSLLVIEENGMVGEYVGGYDDWLRQRRKPAPVQTKSSQTAKKQDAPKTVALKLSYQEKRELESLPQKIETLEREQSALQKQLSDPEFYKNQPDAVTKVSQQLSKLDEELETAYERWAQLEQRAQGKA